MNTMQYGIIGVIVGLSVAGHYNNPPSTYLAVPMGIVLGVYFIFTLG
jgi:hypothetical protein